MLCFPVSIAFLIAVFQISFGYSLKTLVFSATPLSAILGSFLRFTLELFDWPIDHRSSHPLLQSPIVFQQMSPGETMLRQSEFQSRPKKESHGQSSRETPGRLDIGNRLVMRLWKRSIPFLSSSNCLGMLRWADHRMLVFRYC